MLSKQDSRRLAQLERQLRRDDPDFCTRMRGDLPARRRLPFSLLLTAAVIWAAAFALGAFGWWGAAVVAAIWGVVIVAVLVHRRRAREPLPPAW